MSFDAKNAKLYGILKWLGGLGAVILLVKYASSIELTARNVLGAFFLLAAAMAATVRLAANASSQLALSGALFSIGAHLIGVLNTKAFLIVLLPSLLVLVLNMTLKEKADVSSPEKTVKIRLPWR